MEYAGWLGRAGAQKRGRQRLVVLGTGVAVALGLVACGGGGTTISTKAGSITVHHRGSSFQFNTPSVSGSVSGGAKVALPSSFPSAVPRPSGGILVEAEAAQVSSGPGFDLVYRYPSANAASEALTGYDAALRSAGFIENSSISASGTVIQGWKSTKWGVSITVGPTGSSPASEMMLEVSPPK